MTFSQNVKEEITRNCYSNNQLKCILSAFLKNNITINISNNKLLYETKVRNNCIIRFITKSLSSLYRINKTLYFSKDSKLNNLTTYKLEFEGDFNKIENELFIFKDPTFLLQTIEDKQAFLIGAFLSGGSVNNPSSSNYHFEIRSHNFDLIEYVKKIISELGVDAKIMKRKNIYVLYVKKSEYISDLLKYMNASESMYIYEDKRIYRDYTNQMQRLNNLDISNLKKTVDASIDQVKWINELIAHKEIYNSLSEKEKIFCTLRLKYQQATLNNLVYHYKNEFNLVVTRTGLNHYVRKIRNIYNKIKK
ncbi:DNA-binding protein WhiA [Malacoplasma muris]|uniref:DNA-binding protein WhiA n=1 Tax=Malacoplasma muris TaxID=2119 RepID=UPI00398E7271